MRGLETLTARNKGSVRFFTLVLHIVITHTRRCNVRLLFRFSRYRPTPDLRDDFLNPDDAWQLEPALP